MGADRRDGPRLGIRGRGEHGRNCRGCARSAGPVPDGGTQVIGRGDEVTDIGREVGIGEITLTGPEAGEVETQHRDSAGR